MPAMMTAHGSPSRSDLEAELKRLEEQLQRQKLQEEIAKLQEQLESARGVGPAPANGGVNQNDEEVVEEWEEEVEEEEEITEVEEYIEESPPPSPARIIRKPRDKPPAKESSLSPVSPSRRVMPKVKLSNNVFTQNLADKEAAQQQAEQEKAARALAGQPKMGKYAVDHYGDEEEGPLPDLPPFTPRKLPNLPASPSGQETPMEHWLGPKLYKSGKLIATTTVAGCAKQDLILLYFGAAWRRECKDFSKLLHDFYVIAQHHSASIECIYISSDRNLAEFKSCYASMPYLAMPTQTANLKNKMGKEFKLVDWPSLVVLDPTTGLIVTTNGVSDIEQLTRRNHAECQALVQRWKSSPRVSVDEIVGDTRLKHGTMDRGYLYWQE